MHVGEVAVEIKMEDDSNNMTDSPRDDQPSAGMFGFLSLHCLSKRVYWQRFPPHLQYVAMLHCEITKLENPKLLPSFHVECNNQYV